MAATTQYGIYFSLAGTTVRIPVNPEEYTISYPENNTTYNVLDIGEVIVPREPGLREISWEGFFPGNSADPYVVTSGGFRDPKYYINLFNTYKVNGSKPRFIVNRYNEDGGTIFDTNIQVLVGDFDIIEKGGETGDFYYSISLSEYKPIEIEQVSITLTAPKTATAASTPQREKDSGVLSVGDSVIANGTYYYSSYGDSPTGSRSNLRTTITRIVTQTASQPYNYHIGQYGWLKKNQLTKA